MTAAFLMVRCSEPAAQEGEDKRQSPKKQSASLKQETTVEVGETTVGVNKGMSKKGEHEKVDDKFQKKTANQDESAPEQEASNANSYGKKIAFASSNAATYNSEGAFFEPRSCSALKMEGDRCKLMKMYAIKADGTDLTQLTKATAHEYGLGTRISDARKVAVNWQDSTRIFDISYVSGYSPDGTKKAFVKRHAIDGRVANDDIYVANADGTNETRLTTTLGADEFSLVWSPDGTKIAFAWESMGQDGIYLMNPNGTEQKRLIPGGGDLVGGLTWSPDGTKIAFLSMPDYVHPEVYVANSDSTNLRRLTDYSTVGDGITEQVLFSPDSAKIAFAQGGSSRHAIYVMNVDGTGLRRLTNSGDWVGIVSWVGAKNK